MKTEEATKELFIAAGTGDKNADKILAALRNASSVGMTKTEISETVFNKHLSSHVFTVPS